jgi:alkanesulfonate monooxygenase SsuD/methylene tetrahydromethanopterin reductase-like flavin-dependent oxidoreductase (luciferase family)
MKFVFFHLMPYPHLPDDFDERYASPSLDFPNKHFDPKLGNKLYHRYLDELEHAEKLGFDGIAVNEHHQTAYGLMPSPNIMAAALARRTSKAKIMVLGNAIGIRDHPLRVAEEIAMLDHITDGRIVSGFVRGIGWEYYAHSINPTRSRDRFNEAHDLIIKAWTSDEVFEWVSPNYEFRYVNVWPRPLQDPHPPIYIPGAGSTETMRFCAERRYTYMSVYAPTPVVKRWFDGYRSAANDLGYEPDPERLGLSIPVYVAETDEQAHAEGRQHIEWLYHKGLKQGIERVMPPGYTSLGSLRGMLMGRGKAPNEYTYEEIIDNGMAVVGSPDTVGERFEAMMDELGFGQIISLMGVGDMPHYRTIKSMELFANNVMPALRRRAAQSREGSIKVA